MKGKLIVMALLAIMLAACTPPIDDDAGATSTPIPTRETVTPFPAMATASVHLHTPVFTPSKGIPKIGTPGPNQVRFDGIPRIGCIDSNTGVDECTPTNSEEEK